MMLSSQTWRPGLGNRAVRLRDALAEMPQDPASAISWRVKLLENPRSPLALPGAIDLFGHDCIHLLLGRGELPRDEAFVVGFTMGTAACRPWQLRLFRWLAGAFYLPPYRLSATDLEVFDFAVDVARSSRCARLDRVDFRRWLDHPLGEIRRALGLELDVLLAACHRERQRWGEPGDHSATST
jgi:hypothetical protein